MRQVYSRQQIQEILLPYDVGQVLEYKTFVIGIDNTCILVGTKKKEVVLKIYEMVYSRDFNYTRFELSLMQKAHQCGLPAPAVFKTKDGEMISSYQGKPVALMSFLPGDNIFTKQISLKLMRKIGLAAAKMDKCFIGFKPQGREQAEHFWDLKRFDSTKKYLPYLKHDKRADKKLISQIYKDYEKIIKPAFKKCQAGYIHNDIGAHNILAKNNKLTAILDFTDAVQSYFICEVAVSIAQLCLLQKNWQEAIRVFVQAYEEILPLNTTEKSILYHLVNCRLATMIVVCNGLYHSECRHSDYQAIYDMGLEYLLRLKKYGKEKFDRLLTQS